jgi:hypothetical protein
MKTPTRSCEPRDSTVEAAAARGELRRCTGALETRFSALRKRFSTRIGPGRCSAARMRMEVHHGLMTRGRCSDERQTVRRLEVDDVAARGHRSGLFNRERLDVNILVLVRLVW